MHAAPDADAYAAEPTNAYLVHASALVFCARPTVWGFALWGAPTAADTARIVPLLARELADDVPAHASLIDVRRLTAADPRAFAVLAKYLKTNFELFTTRVTRLALVRPAGVLGATVAGFYQVAGAPYPVRVFEELAAACAWLRAPIADELDAIVSSASTLPPILVELRRWLDGHLDDASLASAARALRRSSRSLQRDLGAVATSFQRELDDARIRLAKRLLGTPSPATEIAYEVGCASPQHFSMLFKRVVGVTPSDFRLSLFRAPASPKQGRSPSAGADADAGAGARGRRRSSSARPRRPRAT